MSISTKKLFDNLSDIYQKLPPRRHLNAALRKVTDFIPRKVKYNDKHAEFYGGPMKKMIYNGYEKGLKNLWKSELVAPHLGFKDAGKLEKTALQRSLNDAAGEVEYLTKIITTEDFQNSLDSELDQTERQSLARILSIILHGEMAALLVSSSLVSELKGDAKFAAAQQTFEENKHYIVLRSLVRKIDKVYQQTFWDFILFESIIRAKSVTKLYSMNVLLESIATHFFSAFSKYSALTDILTVFHADESRHVALPHNYAEEGGITFWDKHNPIYQVQRLLMVLPLIGLLFELEEDAKILGIDIFEFGGKIINNVFRLSERSGYYLPINRLDIIRIYNLGVALYKRLNYPDSFQGVTDMTQENTIKISEEMKKVEEDVFGTEDKLRGILNKLLEPGKRRLYDLGVSLLNKSI